MSIWQALIDQSKAAPLLDLSIANTSTLTPLDDYALLVVSGDDAMTFLQGQCTCDFTRLQSGAWLLGAHCTPKGRMLSSFRAIRFDNGDIALRVHASIAESATKALGKYIVFSKATIQNQPLYAIGLTISANRLPSLQPHLSLPEEGQVTQIGNHCALLRLSSERYELWSHDLESFNKLLPLFDTDFLITPREQWTLCEIVEGIAEVRAESVEHLLPQDLNFQLIDGISFSKGCYTGQEIVARMHYKASLKKHLYRAVSMETGVPTPNYGTNILDARQLQRLGTIISSASQHDGRIQLLALVNDEAVTQDYVLLDSVSKPKLQWLPLPYAIPT